MQWVYLWLRPLFIFGLAVLSYAQPGDYASAAADASAYRVPLATPVPPALVQGPQPVLLRVVGDTPASHRQRSRRRTHRPPQQPSLIEQAVAPRLPSEQAQQGRMQRYMNQLESGVDPNAVNESGQTRLHVLAAQAYLHRHNPEWLERLLANPAIDLNRSDTAGDAAIHLAVAGRNWDALRRLLRETRCDILAVNARGQTILHLAASMDDIDGVKWIIRAIIERLLQGDKAVLGVFRVLDAQGLRAEDCGTRFFIQAKIFSAKINLENCDCSQGPSEGCLFEFIEARSLICAMWAVLAGSRLDAVNWRGLTPMHLVVELGWDDLLECMLERGAFIDLTGPDGATVLHAVVASNNRRAVELLIEYILDRPEFFPVLEMRTRSTGETALEMAVRLAYYDIEKMLEQASVQASAPCVQRVPGRFAGPRTSLIPVDDSPFGPMGPYVHRSLLEQFDHYVAVYERAQGVHLVFHQDAYVEGLYAIFINGLALCKQSVERMPTAHQRMAYACLRNLHTLATGLERERAFCMQTFWELNLVMALVVDWNNSVCQKMDSHLFRIDSFMIHVRDCRIYGDLLDAIRTLSWIYNESAYYSSFLLSAMTSEFSAWPILLYTDRHSALSIRTLGRFILRVPNGLVSVFDP
ncbi:MAG TPA: ankyrin repeat domain-containing protein, partial [Opitutales bacterium]|nr:ankyrin repeat domain-containing protein [Opitutales bacterium]